MRFDGFQPSYDYTEMTAIFSGAWQHRRSNLYNRILENPADTTSNPGYIFSDPGTIPGGFTADTTAILHQEAAQATGAIDAWGWDTYHDESIGIDPADYDSHQPNGAQVSKLNRGLKAYFADSSITAPQFWVNLVGDDTGLHFTQTTPYKYLDAQCAFADSFMGDPRYKHTKGGKPFLGLISSASVDQTHWTQCLTHMTHGTPFVIGMPTCAGLTPCDTTFVYGVQNLPAGAGQHAYVDLEAQDKTKWVGTGAATMNWLADRRPFVPGTIWVDQPTQPEAVRHITDAINSAAGAFGGVYTIWNELAEEGPGALQTAQEGTRYTDALKWARKPSSKPVFYTYELTLNSLYVTTVGSWTVQQPGPTGILGAHDSDEISSANTSDSKTLSHPGVKNFGLFASKGPDRGIVEVDVDGSLVTNVDLYAASPTVHQLVWLSSDLPVQTHNVGFVVTGTKNASSSSVKVQLDSVQVTYHPHVVANDNGVPTLYALPPAQERRSRRRRRMRRAA